MDSSGVTVPAERLSQALCGLRPRDHVLGKGRQLGKTLLHPGGDKGAGALAADQQAFVDQAVQRLADGDSRNREIVGQVPLWRQGLVGGQHVLGDRRAQGALQLLIQRRAALFVQSADGLGEVRH